MTTTSTHTSASRVVSPDRWPGGRALAVNPLADQAILNLDECVGQRQATWTFDLIDGVTGQRLGELHPVKQPATISHETLRVIKRDLRIALDVTDTAAVNPIRDRVIVHMHIGGLAYPLGRFMFTDATSLTSTGGDQGMMMLLDEMFLIDQQTEQAFASTDPVDRAVRALLTGAPLVDTLTRHPDIRIEPTDFASAGGWTAGTTRGQILHALAAQGDYETPWIDHTGTFRMIRTVDPDTAPASLDLDTGRRVIRSSIGQASDILRAPNRFIVIGNDSSASSSEVVGSYDVPATAPHSITNRGFVIPQIIQMQVATLSQAKAAGPWFRAAPNSVPAG